MKARATGEPRRREQPPCTLGTAVALGILQAVGASCAIAVQSAGPLTAAATAAEPPEPAADDSPVGDPTRGQRVYQRCMACHSLDEDDIGPHHRGVVGRRAGSVAGYAYSPALRNSGLVWDRATLDRWLENPGQLVPGAKMFFSLPDPRDRRDVIAYLDQQR